MCCIFQDVSVPPPHILGSVLQHYESELKRLRSEYAGLSGNKRADMEKLLVEGDLLEVTLDEVQQLWLVLHQDAETLTAYDKFAVEEEGERGKEEEGRRRKRKVALSSASGTSALVDAGGASAGSSVEGAFSRQSRVPPAKRQKRVTRSTTPKASPSPAPSNTSSHSKCSIQYLLQCAVS